MSSPVDANVVDTEKPALELQRLRKEVEKLSLEVEALHTSSWWDRMLGRYLPLVTALLAVGGFWAGLIGFYRQRQDAEEERVISDRSRTQGLVSEAARPFWETQLALYIKASDSAALIATNKRYTEVRASAEGVFWKLYWGPLSCVEDMTMSASRPPKLKQQW